MTQAGRQLGFGMCVSGGHAACCDAAYITLTHSKVSDQHAHDRQPAHAPACQRGRPHVFCACCAALPHTQCCGVQSRGQVCADAAAVATLQGMRTCICGRPKPAGMRACLTQVRIIEAARDKLAKELKDATRHANAAL